MAYKGQIWFSTRERDGFVEFHLGNAGSVIPPESLPKLFEAFFTSGKKGGTGLGLAIAEKVVKAHGGEIWCESAKTERHPDGYVEFKFTLPVAEGQSSKATPALPAHSSEITKVLLAISEAAASDASSVSQDELSLEVELIQATKAIGRSLRVLIVDDEDVYRQGLAGSLARTPELNNALVIRMAADSHQALDLCTRAGYDLIITDVDMGPASLCGFDLVEQLRGVPAVAKSLISVNSNRIVAEEHKTAIASGADAFISKPASRVQLLKLLLQAAQKAGGAAKITEPAVALGKPEVLVLDDNVFILEAWQDTLQADAEVHLLDSPEALIAKLEQDSGFLDRLACVITDQNFDGSNGNGIDIGRMIKCRRSSLIVLLSSDGEFGGVDLAGSVDHVIAKDPAPLASLAQHYGF